MIPLMNVVILKQHPLSYVAKDPKDRRQTIAWMNGEQIHWRICDTWTHVASFTNMV